MGSVKSLSDSFPVNFRRMDVLHIENPESLNSVLNFGKLLNKGIIVYIREADSVTIKKYKGILSMFRVGQRKVLEIFLQNDINKNRGLFEKLAKL